MGRRRKSEIDRMRDEYSRRWLLKKRALLGPFQCPKCLTDKRLTYRTKVGKLTETYINQFGVERTRTVPKTEYLFICSSCKFTKLVVKRGPPSVIDVYNKLYDEELSPRDAEELRSLVHDIGDFRIIHVLGPEKR